MLHRVTWSVALLSVFVVLVPQEAEARRKFKKKECLDCHDHEAWAEATFSKPVLHEPVKEKKCQSCHQRHGLVGALLLKQDGNELCLSCHEPKTLGLDLPNAHAPDRRGRCTA